MFAPPQPGDASPSARPPETCESCGGRGWRVEADGGAGRAIPCECRQRDRRPEYLANSGVPPRYRDRRLSNFRTDWLPEKGGGAHLLRAKQISQQYVDTFLDVEQGGFRQAGLIFIGPPGIGKTHLAASVLVELIERYGVAGRFADFSALLDEIRATFDGDGKSKRATILRSVIDAEVLVLDELGAQKPSAWVMDQLYLIMNSRYTAGRATLFTTNYHLSARSESWSASGVYANDEAQMLATRIAAPLVSRLWEMAQPVVMTGSDYRRQVMSHRHQIGG